MNLKVENLLLFLMVVADFERSVLSFDPKCPPLKLVSGRSRYQWRGRSVRFNCMRSYQLVGVKYATCMNGKWDAEVPICVKYGCRVPSTTHVNGQFIESYRGAVVKIVCNPGYSLIGSPSVYCNGIRWNESFPVCRATNKNPALSCNFEEEDLCGWSQDPMHDFDWKWRNSPVLEDAGTNLTSNHSRGHYIYIESSGSMGENDTARIFSPVYPPEYSNGTCFRFWYRLHGSPTGFLKVYVKPEGVELWYVIPSFWMNGDEEDFWTQTFIRIPPMETPFQIVVEAVRGPGALGETGFDDVRLTSAEECSAQEAMTSSTSSTDVSYSAGPYDDFVVPHSCINRCGYDYNPEKASGTSPADYCSCTDNCNSEGSCCPDYFETCTFSPSTPTPTATSTQTNVFSESTSSPATLPSVQPDKLPSPNPPLKHFNNESNEIDPGKSLAQLPSSANTPSRVSNEVLGQKQPPSSRANPKSPILHPPSKTTTARNDNSKSAPSATTTGNRMTPKVALPKPSTSKTKSEKVPANGSETNATWSKIPRRDARPGPDGKAKPAAVSNGTSVTSSSTTATTPTRTFKKSNANNVMLTYLEKPSRSNLSDDSRFTKGKPKEVSGKEPPQAMKIDKSDDSSGVPIREIVEFGGTAMSVLVVAAVGFFWYKRREIRKTERDNMVEDSDSIVYEMKSSTLGRSEYHSLVCIRPGGLGQPL